MVTAVRLASLAGVGVTLAGCTLVGLGVGAIVDSRKAPPPPIPGWQVETLSRGSKLIVTTRGGVVIGGAYDGVIDMPPAEYAQRYAQHQAQSGSAPLPALGPGATLWGGRGASDSCDLLGFHSAAVIARCGGRSDVSRLEFDRLERVEDAAGRSADAATLQNLAITSRLPLLAQIVVRTSKSSARVAVDDVIRVDLPARRHGKAIGALVGAVVDSLLVIAAMQIEPIELGDCTGSCASSCPFVYSFDGTGYRLDSEAFGGAIYEKAQRADLDNLDHARATDGVYRLKIANELPETQYVDEMTLVVADHPVGTRVLPDFGGRAHLIERATPPTSAADLQGRDVTGQVRASDGDVWISNPFGRDPDRVADVRDGIVADFPRPPGAKSVKLTSKVQNTLWASHLMAQFLELPGDGIDDWYRRLDTSAAERNRLRDTMVREAMLRVAVEEGAEWREAGFVWAVGPAVPKELVVPVDLRDDAGGRLRVRVDATAGLWMIDSLQADFSPDRPLRVQEVAAVTARDHRGADLTDTLRRADGRRYSMPTNDDWAEVAFPDPPPAPGLVRSVLLRSTGYYRVHSSGHGVPQTDLMESLLGEPGAYGRYTLRLLNRRVADVLRAGEAGR